MTLKANAQPAHPSGGSDAKRNFILQQELCDPAVQACAPQYSALLFQPRLAMAAHVPAFSISKAIPHGSVQQ